MFFMPDFSGIPFFCNFHGESAFGLELGKNQPGPLAEREVKNLLAPVSRSALLIAVSCDHPPEAVPSGAKIGRGDSHVTIT